MKKTPIILHLHSHMPFILNHGEWPHGNAWLSEVVFESYLPLLEMMQNLCKDGIKAGISFDFSPILLEQLAHHDAKNIFKRFAESQIAQAECDIQKFTQIPNAKINLGMGEYWRAFYSNHLQAFEEKYEYSILKGLKEAEKLGLMESMTSGLTHAYLPLLNSRKSVLMQIQSARILHQRLMGKQTQGMFLPECGYAPIMYDSSGEYHLEDILLDESIEMIILDQQHQLNYVIDDLRHLPESLRPLRIIRLERVYSGRNVRAFIRHKTACDKVWSEQEGYPTHADYLDFHKKEYDSSLKYWKVTNHVSDSDAKLPYSPEEAGKQALLDAQNYIIYLEQLAMNYHNTCHQHGVICLAFDTELFGHWWFEGPQFLEHFIREIQKSEILEMRFPSEISWNDHTPIAQSSFGSWGVNGTDETWRNEQTTWLLRKIHESEQMFESAIQTCLLEDAMQVRILNQALRELLLMQASDWPFLITRNQAVDYAQNRFMKHHEYFLRLIVMFEALQSGVKPSTEDLSMLANIEQTDDVLQAITIHQWSNH